jgi:hypothetical protein
VARKNAVQLVMLRIQHVELAIVERNEDRVQYKFIMAWFFLHTELNRLANERSGRNIASMSL